MPLLVSHVITRLIRGGAQVTLYNLLRGLGARGVRCEVVTGGEAGSEGSILEEVTRLGIPVAVLPCLGREFAPGRDARALLALARHFAGRKPAIVHTHTSKAGLLGALAARTAGVPSVVYTPQGHIFAPHGAIPGVTDRPGLRPLYLGLRQLAESLSDRVVALTCADLEEQVALGLAPREKYVVIHNGVDPAPFQDLPPKNPSAPPLVMAVGRLSPEKGQDILLEALTRLPGVRVALVGDGPTRAALEARASQPDLAGRVRFLGLRTDVPTCLASADLFVLPSRYEAQGMVVVEAMMAGLPIVASRVGGVPGILQDGVTGRLVPPADPAALANAIRAVLAEGGLATGEAARRHALANLGTDAMVDAYVSLYVDLLEGRG